jgi:hypothetical protein
VRGLGKRHIRETETGDGSPELVLDVKVVAFRGGLDIADGPFGTIGRQDVCRLARDQHTEVRKSLGDEVGGGPILPSHLSGRHDLGCAAAPRPR